MDSSIARKAREFMFKTRSVNQTNVLEFIDEINALLEAGWDILSSQSIGLDTGGGVSGSGNIMMVVSLVRYDYIKLLDAPAPNAPEAVVDAPA